MSLFRTVLSALYRGWMKFAHVLAVVNTTLLLTIVYVVLIGPIALVRKLFRRDTLEIGIPPEQESFWKVKDPVHHTVADSRRQF